MKNYTALAFATVIIAAGSAFAGTNLTTKDGAPVGSTNAPAVTVGDGAVEATPVKKVVMSHPIVETAKPKKHAVKAAASTKKAEVKKAEAKKEKAHKLELISEKPAATEETPAPTYYQPMTTPAGH